VIALSKKSIVSTAVWGSKKARGNPVGEKTHDQGRPKNRGKKPGSPRGGHFFAQAAMKDAGRVWRRREKAVGDAPNRSARGSGGKEENIFELKREGDAELQKKSPVDAKGGSEIRARRNPPHKRLTKKERRQLAEGRKARNAGRDRNQGRKGSARKGRRKIFVWWLPKLSVGLRLG